MSEYKPQFQVLEATVKTGKIIDFQRKGNVVRFFIGPDECNDYWGDDWNDAPYDCNAGEVYDSYVTGHVDVVFSFDWLLTEPDSDSSHVYYTKEDMKKRLVPCIVAVPEEVSKELNFCERQFDKCVASAMAVKFYFEDSIDKWVK